MYINHMVIYSIGCSHTYGHCLTNKDLVWSNIVMDDLTDDYQKFGTNINKLTKESISNVNNIFVNDSVCGAGNDYIYHKTLENVSLLIRENKTPDYVFVQWSGPNRRQHCLPDGNIVYVNLFDNVDLGIKFEPMASEHTVHYMFSLQEFLKNNNIKYYFFNYFGLDESIKNLNIFNKLDFDFHLNFDLDRNCIFNGLLDFMVNNEYSCDDDGHPNEKGNQFIANHILNKIKYNEFNN
jgi:hypothetical protein